MVEPLKPEDIDNVVGNHIPDAVIEVFNALIARNWTGTRATIVQNEAIDAIEAHTGLTRGEIFAKKYLDVEPLFRRVGWIVEYDKPAYDETYAAHFVFSKGRR